MLQRTKNFNFLHFSVIAVQNNNSIIGSYQRFINAATVNKSGRNQLFQCCRTGSRSTQSFTLGIFRRFYREEEVHEQQGVGIGLYLAREIVMRQGGYVKVVSEPGKGSEFSIMLPTK